MLAFRVLFEKLEKNKGGTCLIHLVQGGTNYECFLIRKDP